MVDVHPVAKLLTPEMKARVRAATFYIKRGAIRGRGRCAYPDVLDNGQPCQGCLCPLAIALDLSVSPIDTDLARRLGTDQVATVSEFVYLADSGDVAPEDIKIMLGCDEP